MTSVLPITVVVVCVVCGTVFALPCLTNKFKEDFNKARTALKSLENFLKSQASSINSKVQALDKDMISMEEDFKPTHFWLGSTDIVNGDWRWIYDQTQLSYKNFASRRTYTSSSSNSCKYNCITIHYSDGNCCYRITSALRFNFFVICVVCGTVFSLPCLTIKSKPEFNKARDALKSLEDFLKSQTGSIDSEIQALDNDITSMEEDFKRRQWIKYNNHCYCFGTNAVRWTEAEEDLIQPVVQTLTHITVFRYITVMVTGRTAHARADIPMSVKVISVSKQLVKAYRLH
ncbi:unnamed protein product [Mytilus coruscus]|uniref:C-type lectin domain-containing protein n=1 Tax=Mytilus coruscus TaxID=42192 RepID=A0A6J8A3R8_MYTCO|nr:unnamed protein product [Mytilus coruscus]